MSKPGSNIARRRRKGSYLTTIIGISMVLTLLGALGFTLLNAKTLDTYIREKIELRVFIKDSAKEVDISKLQKSIDSAPSTHITEFVSKEQAAKIQIDQNGQNFMEFLDGYNPLPATIVLRLKADYMSPDSVAWISQELEEVPIVREVASPPDLIEAVHGNMNKLGFILLGISLFLLLIAFMMINNTIRLAMYSKRFLIRSMQLVGATRGFIQRPFLWQGIIQGLVSGIIAMGAILGLVYFLKDYVPEGIDLMNTALLLKLFGATVLTGILIAFFSTMFAVNKYIGMELDELY
jgi:cell division transport system permease protein